MDWYVALAPLLLLPVVGLLRFIGCFSKPEFHGASILTIMPDVPVTLRATETQQYTAVASWDADAQIDWSVSSGSSTPGTITPVGLYNAPATILTAYTEQVVATSADGGTTITAMADVNLIPGNSATFVRFDDLTQGSWHGAYGADGYALAHLPQPEVSLPAYLPAFPTPPQIFSWQDPSILLKSLQNPANTGRYAYTWFDANGFNFTFDFADQQVHQVAVYCVDWDTQGRQQTITMFDADTSATLGGPQALSGFPSGTYAVWQLSGRVRMQVTHTGGGLNAVVSGIFFR